MLSQPLHVACTFRPNNISACMRPLRGSDGTWGQPGARGTPERTTRAGCQQICRANVSGKNAKTHDDAGRATEHKGSAQSGNRKQPGTIRDATRQRQDAHPTRRAYSTSWSSTSVRSPRKHIVLPDKPDKPDTTTLDKAAEHTSVDVRMQLCTDVLERRARFGSGVPCGAHEAVDVLRAVGGCLHPLARNGGAVHIGIGQAQPWHGTIGKDFPHDDAKGPHIALGCECSLLQHFDRTPSDRHLHHRRSTPPHTRLQPTCHAKVPCGTRPNDNIQSVSSHTHTDISVAVHYNTSRLPAGEEEIAQVTVFHVL
eukprot:m.1478262 g.1478262  ORF g.1478262 m.1478262 type:complete len:311 (-) comp25165_c0_seq4:2591-3523(-)